MLACHHQPRCRARPDFQEERGEQRPVIGLCGPRRTARGHVSMRAFTVTGTMSGTEESRTWGRAYNLVKLTARISGHREDVFVKPHHNVLVVCADVTRAARCSMVRGIWNPSDPPRKTSVADCLCKPDARCFTLRLMRIVAKDRCW